MENEPTNTNDSAEKGELQGDASPEPSYVTADQFQSFQKDMLGNMRKVMAGMMKTQPATQSISEDPNSEKTSEPAPQVDIQGMMKREREVSRAIHKNGFSDDQEDLVRQMIDAAGPDDVGDFLKDLASKFGVSVANPSTEEKPMKAANPNPASDGGSPGMTRTEDSDETPAWKWSQDKVDRMIGKLGYRGFAKEVERNLQTSLKGKRFSTTNQR